jgi:hypothetical protein
MTHRTINENDRRIASLDLLINRASFGAARILAAGFVSAALLATFTADTVDGVSHPSWPTPGEKQNRVIPEQPRSGLRPGAEGQ